MHIAKKTSYLRSFENILMRDTAFNMKAGGYLMSRGWELAEVVKYRIGWFDGSFRVPSEAMSLMPGLGDVFNEHHVGSLVFPIRNVYGEPNGFQLRSLVREKEISTFRDHELSMIPGAFNLDEATAKAFMCRAIVLTEGPFDCVPVNRFVPAIALMGTKLSDALAVTLARFCNRVFLALDNTKMDKAGREGASKILKTLSSLGITTSLVDYGPFKDPGLAAVADSAGFQRVFRSLLLSYGGS